MNMLTPRQEREKRYREKVAEMLAKAALVDSLKAKYKVQYDRLFNLIRKAKKGSSWHLTLLKIELKYHNRTKKLINQNALHFSQKRKKIFQDLENKGVYGERPNFEENPEPDFRRTTGQSRPMSRPGRAYAEEE